MYRYINSFGLAYCAAAILTAVLFATKVAIPAFGEWAEVTFGHAWLYMAVLGIVVFAGGGLLPLRLKMSDKALAATVATSTVLSGGVIALVSLISANLYGPMG